MRIPMTHGFLDTEHIECKEKSVDDGTNRLIHQGFSPNVIVVESRFWMKYRGLGSRALFFWLWRFFIRGKQILKIGLPVREVSAPCSGSHTLELNCPIISTYQAKFGGVTSRLKVKNWKIGTQSKTKGVYM